MSAPQETDRNLAENAREIAKWANRYARSRTVPFLVQWVFVVVAGTAVIGPLLLALTAYQQRETSLSRFWFAVFLVAFAALTFFSFSQWCRARLWELARSLYGKEGYAELMGSAAEASSRRRWLPHAAGWGLALYHFIAAALIGAGYVPWRFMQPISALYMVPFLALMARSQRLGFWAWLWPILYALHAVLMLAGAPVRFHGPWGEVLNLIVPLFGYGLVSMLVGHAYSRYALRRLKGLARTGLEPGSSGAEAG